MFPLKISLLPVHCIKPVNPRQIQAAVWDGGDDGFLWLSSFIIM